MKRYSFIYFSTRFASREGHRDTN